MTEKTLKEKLARYLKLKEEVEKLESEMKKIKKSIEPYIDSELKLPYKEKYIKVNWIAYDKEIINKELLKEKYYNVFKKVVGYCPVKYLNIKLVKK